MSEKKKFLLRIDAEAYAALEKWASDDLRSINAQIEFVLKESLRRAGRPTGSGEAPAQDTQPEEKETE